MNSAKRNHPANLGSGQTHPSCRTSGARRKPVLARRAMSSGCVARTASGRGHAADVTPADYSSEEVALRLRRKKTIPPPITTRATAAPARYGVALLLPVSARFLPVGLGAGAGLVEIAEPAEPTEPTEPTGTLE